jgi:glycosyltransferase involved in cell wall biosynthesis
MAAQALVSIITPAYNEATFLPECIESILKQTYKNWEYTIIDNQSTDGSEDIAAQYAKKDARIHVCRNRDFLPAIANHNAALRQISSESKYCKIVFADDWIFPECLERMVAAAEENPSVGIVSAYTLEGEKIMLTGLPYQQQVISGREICRRHLLDDLYVFGSANSLLYRADLVRSHDPFFNEENIHADTEACFALLKVSDFAFVHQVLTYTRVRPNSLTSVSENLQTNWAGMLKILMTQGRNYLTDDEWQQRLKKEMSGYYRFLGKRLLRCRDSRFWQWHRSVIEATGIGFSRTRVVQGTLIEICEAILNPKQSLDRYRAARAEWRHQRESWSEQASASVERTVG